MRSFAHSDRPFFDGSHRRFAMDLAHWADREVDRHIDRNDVDRTCRTLVRALGDAGWLKAVVATEMAQRVIDRAAQIFGGNGVRDGVKVEALYREVRALRIHEGATEVQKVFIARDLLKSRRRGIAERPRQRERA
jgi:alkylation response protein AidB-like acyl-CoA dehydrogenase